MVTEFDWPLLLKPRLSSHQRRSVSSLQIRNISDDLAIGVHHHDMRATRDVDTMGRGVRVHIVPAAFAAEHNLFNQVIPRTLRRGQRVSNECSATRT